MLDLGTADRVGASPRDRHGANLICLGQHQRQLLTPVPGDQVSVPCHLLQHPRNRPKHIITGRMAVPIIQTFEVIQVQRHQTQRRSVPHRAGHLL